METEIEPLSKFVTPGAASHIRVQLVEIRQRCDELMGKIEQLGVQLNQSTIYRQRCNDNLKQVQNITKHENVFEGVLD